MQAARLHDSESYALFRLIRCLRSGRSQAHPFRTYDARGVVRTGRPVLRGPGSKEKSSVMGHRSGATSGEKKGEKKEWKTDTKHRLPRAADKRQRIVRR